MTTGNKLIYHGVIITRICAAEMAVRYEALSACRKIHVCSGVGSNLQVGGHNAGAKRRPNFFFMCPLTFLLCPHMRGHNDCLLPTEIQ